MSAALARLRHLFNDPLFERIGSEHRLTPLAESLAQPLQVALAAVERTLDRNPAFDPSTAARRFRLAMSDHLLVVLCPPLVQRISELAPGVQLHTLQTGPDIARHLASRRIDLSIQPANLVRGVHHQAVLVDRWMCAVWRDHPQVKEQITRELLATLMHASFHGGPTPLSELQLAPLLGRAPSVQVTTQSFVSLAFLLRGTSLIALIQRSLGLRVQDAAEIRLLEVPLPVAEPVFEMSWNPLFTPDPGHTWLRGVIAQVAKEVIGPP